MKTQLRVFGAGVQFLTRIPVPASLGYEPDDLARSTVYFPVIGVIVGAAGAGVYWLAAEGWPSFVAATLAIAATIWLTGAFHEDALADAFDGFGGGWGREQVLAIMKDSRVGSYGAVAVAVMIVLKAGALSTLGVPDAVRALIAGHVVARWSSLPLIWGLPYVRESSATGKPFAASVTPGRLAVGTVLMLAIIGPVLGLDAGFGLRNDHLARVSGVLVVAVLVTAASAAYYRRRIGGITGDCLGTTNQLVEAATYLALTYRVHG